MLPKQLGTFYSFVGAIAERTIQGCSSKFENRIQNLKDVFRSEPFNDHQEAFRGKTADKQVGNSPKR